LSRIQKLAPQPATTLRSITEVVKALALVKALVLCGVADDVMIRNPILGSEEKTSAKEYMARSMALGMNIN
jgi:hypothetical protein